MKHLHPSRTLLAAAILVPSVLLADSINPADYAKSFDITFPGYTGATALTDFPVLVRLSAARNGFDYNTCAANGADLRFSDSAGNLIPHEIDTWNPSGESLVWVKVTSLTSSTKITAHYGYTGEGSLPAVTAADVWDSGYIGVWHLGQSSTPMNDSTSGGANLTASNATNIGFEATGIVGNAVQFGLNDSVSGRLQTTQASCMLQGESSFTLECWSYQDVYDNGTFDREVVLIQELGRDPWKTAFRLYEAKSSSGSKGRTVLQFNGSAAYFNGNVNKPQRAVWNHQAWRYSSDVGGALFMNGRRDCNLSAQGAVPSDTSPLLFLGNCQDNNLAYPGKMDEVRISTVVRTDDWIKATYDTIMDENFAEYDASASNDWTQYAHTFAVSFTGYACSSAVTDFPALVRISEDSPLGFSYSDCLKPNGGDLRFADENGNLLPSEVDTWNPNGVSLIWVKVPSLSASTKITGYYGWASAPSIPASAVWSNGFVGVWHLNESALPMKESSRASSAFTSSSGDGIGFAAEGVVGGSVDFGAAGNRRSLTAYDSDALDGFAQFTVELWTYTTAANRPTGSDPNTGLLAKRISTSSQVSYYLVDTTGSGGATTKFNISQSGTSGTQISDKVRPENDVWTHQAYMFDGTNGKVAGWKDGVSVHDANTTVATSIFAGTANLYLGNFSDTDSRNFPGKIDELRISNVARSTDWIKATHDMIVDPNFAECEMVAENDWKKYSHKFSVTFNGYDGQTTLTDFPVLVKVSTNGISGFSYADCKKPNGKDLRFADENGNLLSSEVDTWNTNGESLVWVKVPSLTASTKITGYYGWDLAPQVMAADVWDENYVGVWHLGAAGSAMQKDSTTNRHDFVCSSAHLEKVNLAVADGAVGGAVGFNVTADRKGRLTAADTNGRLSGFMDCTIETWLYPTNNDLEHGRLIMTKRQNYNAMSYHIYADKDGGNDCRPRFLLGRESNSGVAVYPGACNKKPELDTWSHLAFTRLGSSGSINAYLNKEKVLNNLGTSAPGQLFSNPAIPLVLGNSESADSTSAYPGNMDEVRISNIVRSTDWLEATYDTVTKADFATYSAAYANIQCTVLFLR